MSMRKPYPSDLADERWELVEPVITAWKARHPSVSGHQGKYAMREIVNAILYQNRTGCQWEFLPHDMPPPGAVKYYFYLWRDEGTDQDIHDLLRWQLREKRKRLADPSLVVLDTQSIHVAIGVPATTTGRDAAKRVPGRKRCLAVDVLGLVVAVRSTLCQDRHRLRRRLQGTTQPGRSVAAGKGRNRRQGPPTAVRDVHEARQGSIRTLCRRRVREDYPVRQYGLGRCCLQVPDRQRTQVQVRTERRGCRGSRMG